MCQLQWSNHVNRFKSKLVIRSIQDTSFQTIFLSWIFFSTLFCGFATMLLALQIQNDGTLQGVVLYAEINCKKKTLRSSHDSKLGPLNFSQMLLPTEPLELWHWSREKYGSILGLDLLRLQIIFQYHQPCQGVLGGSAVLRDRGCLCTVLWDWNETIE